MYLFILGTMRKLLEWIKDNMIKDRKDLFIQGDSVRPGILVLVNESDWELLVRIYMGIFGIDNNLGNEKIRKYCITLKRMCVVECGLDKF